MYYNCNKDRYYALSCLQLKNIGDIKEMEEGEISNELEKKRTLGEDPSLGYPVNLKEINLSQLIGGKYFMVPCIVF